MPEIQPWVVAGRMTGIIGMGLTISLSILFLLGALWVPGVIALLLTVPFFVLMVTVERSKAARSMSGKPPDALEP
jgi:ABC-type Na+ efflux pump permease subunit